MKIAILTEGGKGLGFGHLTRCMALYSAFEKKGAIPKMAVKGDESAEYLIGNRNYEMFDWLREKNKLNALLDGSDAAVIDSYLAKKDFYKELSKKIDKVVYIDDNARLDYPKGTIVNVNVYGKEMEYPKKRGRECIGGSEYALLRNEFCDIPKKKINKTLKKVMIIFGGANFGGMMANVLEFFRKKYPDLTRNIVIGKAFENGARLKELKSAGVNLINNPGAEEMKNIMLDSDIAISAGGQTLAELARVGIPTIGICVADNQHNNLKGWQKTGFLEFIGWHRDANILEKLQKAIEKIKPYEKRLEMSRIGRGIVDGMGAQRLAEALL